MLIIPVLDIKGGLVVRARMGLREAYRPIETPLSATAHIGDIAEGLRRLHPFPVFYVADLDAIEGRAGPLSVAKLLPGLSPLPEIWIDAGFRDRDSVAEMLETVHASTVLGSETQEDIGILEAFRSNPKLILSLDFKGNDFQGPHEILERPELWPERIIVMTLARVGAASGPDVDRLRAILERADGRQVFAAGGVRNAADLEKLQTLGVSGALVATSLHDGTLSGPQISAFMKRG
ncbi:MAG: HisA/HisF-related TIM barrel protein [Shinella sp.]|nr:HisA/HisF-related TIM barrel protein [Shinella sp.]